MDYNEDCLELTREKMMGLESNVEYILNSELKVPLQEESVDYIVAWGALFYLARDKEERLLLNLVKCLKKGGLLLADYRAKDDYLYGHGIEVERDFYQLDNSCGSLSGITYAFRDIEELKQLYDKMKMTIINYEKIEHYVNNCSQKNSHYIIWAKRDE
jgi:ubiquinone/menaquinone biosynthesis C-methylase UbiE